MWETWVQSLGWEDPLEKEMATHSSILAWKISWTQEPGGLQFMGSQRVGDNWATNTCLLIYLLQESLGKVSTVLEVIPGKEMESASKHKEHLREMLTVWETVHLLCFCWVLQPPCCRTWPSSPWLYLTGKCHLPQQSCFLGHHDWPRWKMIVWKIYKTG